MKLSLMLPAVLAATGLLASATEAAKNAELEAPTTSGGLRASTTHQDARRTNRYWVAPVRNSGLTCIDNSIRAGGGKPNEICMTEGEALCIEYDYKPMGGRWQFGIKDSKLRLYNPKGEVVYEYCSDVTHLCIGEKHGFDPNRYSKERPYLTLYDEKVHEVVGSLTCDGTDGKVSVWRHISDYVCVCVEYVISTDGILDASHRCLLVLTSAIFLSISSTHISPE